MRSQIAYDIDPVFGCWIWSGKVGNNGRPIVWRGRAPVSAYKLLYEEQVGPVADGLVLDHLCRRPTTCVRPLHVEPVTRHENELRKSWAYRCRRKQCAKGHDLSTAMVTPEMGRLCRECMVMESPRVKTALAAVDDAIAAVSVPHFLVPRTPKNTR